MRKFLGVMAMQEVVRSELSFWVAVTHSIYCITKILIEFMVIEMTGIQSISDNSWTSIGSSTPNGKFSLILNNFKSSLLKSEKDVLLLILSLIEFHPLVQYGKKSV